MNNSTVEFEEGHLGVKILESLKKYENELNQIEVVNDAVETHGSVRLRSIRMAQALKSKGFKKGDVILLDAVNHNDICIPYLASLYLGAVPIGLSKEMKHVEIKHILSIAKPSLVFADPDVALAIKKVLVELNNPAEIVIFGNEKISDFLNFSEFVEKTGTEDSFVCEKFCPKNTMALLACSSGTTGLPKLVKISHYALYLVLYLSRKGMSEAERRGTIYLSFSPIYWITGSSSILSSCLIGHTRIQSMKSFSPEDFEKASRVYKPTISLCSQVVLSSLLKYVETHNIDFSSYRAIFNTGSSSSEDSIEKIQKLVPNGKILGAYACTEILAIAMSTEYKNGSCGKINPFNQWKVIDIETGKKLGPNQNGELRLKSPFSFMGYYNNPEATAAAFDEEGYFKTGDLVYYDEEGYLYVVDRIKELIKFRNYQISSAEVENLINSIPGVILSAVVGIPHHEDGEHPMAFVQLDHNVNVSEQQIKDVVKENMSDAKQLRAGVIFVDSLPSTYTGKLDRKELREMKKKYYTNMTGK